MKKYAYFFIDDVIWVFRDLTRQRPKSIFDHHFLKSLRETHDKTGLKVQMNLFYRTSSFYGIDDFSLSDVTDAYKAEFEANSDWLKFSFHAKEEFPDYPNINLDYEETKTTLSAIKDEDTGLFFKVYCNTGTVNLCKNFKEVEEDTVPALDNEYLGFLIHEQYYYPDYYAYQPDAAEKVEHAAKLIADAGFEFVTGEELI